MADPITFAADAMAAGLQAQNAASDRFFGVTRSVNTDGTLTVESGAGIHTSVRSLAGYTPRVVGDTVLCVMTGMGPVVQGKVSGPATEPAVTAMTISDSAAPGGQGWEEVVSAHVWAKPGALWLTRTVALPPPTGGSVGHAATTMATYRSGGIITASKAEQGDYTGRGLCTGLAAFDGSWAGLSGHTATGGTLTVHRSAGGHGFTYGPVNVWAYPCLVTGVPAATPTPIGDPIGIPVSLNETGAGGVPAWWGQPFCAGTANAVAFWSASGGDNVELDATALTVTY